MTLLDKYIAATDLIRRGFTARGIANGLMITRGFSFPRIAGGYARQNVTTKFSQSGGNASQAENNATITFAVATASWGTIFGWAIYDAATAGNKLFKGSWATAKTIDINDQFQVGAGDLTIAFD